MLKSNLLATKLHRPALPARWVQRPHLYQRLNEGLELRRQITLVSAPAGFGKTTCVSEWVNALEGRWPVTWLSLDPADDDPGRFFACFVAIVSQAVDRIERSGVLPPISAVAYGVLAQVHYQWYELEAARRQILRALELSTLGGYNSSTSFCRVFLSRLFQLEGDVAAASREIGKAVDLVQRFEMSCLATPLLASWVIALMVFVTMAFGRHCLTDGWIIRRIDSATATREKYGHGQISGRGQHAHPALAG